MTPGQVRIVLPTVLHPPITEGQLLPKEVLHHEVIRIKEVIPQVDRHRVLQDPVLLLAEVVLEVFPEDNTKSKKTL